MGCVLVVDDDREDLQAAVALLRTLHGIEVHAATSAEEALVQLGDQSVMLVVTDLHMPKMDGLELLQRIRERYPQLPVVVMTSRGSEESAASALNLGASGYVPKRCLESQLVPVVQKILNSMAARNERQRLEDALDFTETRFVIRNDGRLSSPIVGYLQEKAKRLLPFDENELVRIGIAIDEALNNAIYHGNLEIRSELRDASDEAFREAMQHRSQQSPFNERKVHVVCRVSSREFVCVIRDEGPGFEVESVRDPLAPENLENAGGRGLLMIREFMDEVHHNETANEITMVKRIPTESQQAAIVTNSRDGSKPTL